MGMAAGMNGMGRELASEHQSAVYSIGYCSFYGFKVLFG